MFNVTSSEIKQACCKCVVKSLNMHKMHLNIRNFTNFVTRFATKRMNFPDPNITVKRLHQCLAFAYQPEQPPQSSCDNKPKRGN